MPIILDANLETHLGGETTTLATLWQITRRDGTVFRYTDHDVEIVYDGNTYKPGIGYNRSAIEDKGDLSVDNMNTQGYLAADDIERADVRAGLFDNAEVYITVVNYEDLTQTGIIRRRGWFGEVKINSLGQFDTELRGLTQALSETFHRVYTPMCDTDLGSSKCKVAVDYGSARTRVDGETLYVGDWRKVPAYPDYVWRVTQAGITDDTTNYDETIYDASAPGDTALDGTAELTAVARIDKSFTVVGVTDRTQFLVSVAASELGDDPTYFDGGLITFSTGDNAGLSFEVYTFTPDSADDGEVRLYLRTSFNVQVGDTGTLYPGCDKTVATCKARFDNFINYQGFPHVPGERYLAVYPDSKL